MSDSIVLCYHAVSETWPAPLSVTPGGLQSQLELLVRRGYGPATFSEVASGRHDRPVVAVTFDDAFASVLTLAAPILDRVGLIGTLFVPTDFPDRPAPLSWPGIDQWVGGTFESELSALSWEQIANLQASGWEIGSHTRSHPHLTKLGDAELDAELAESKASCERRLGRECPSIAYPYGDYDERVVLATGRAGYRFACTLPDRIHPARPLAWPRIGVYHRDDERRYRLKVSPAVRRLRGLSAWTRVDGLRRRPRG